MRSCTPARRGSRDRCRRWPFHGRIGFRARILSLKREACERTHDKRDAKNAVRIRDPMILLRVARKTAPNLKGRGRKCHNTLVMIALIQRVTRAEVRVGERILGAIELGIAALIGVRRADEESDADRLIERMLGYRIFPDPAGRMNLDLGSVGGGSSSFRNLPRGRHARGMRSGLQYGRASRQGQCALRVLVQRASERPPARCQRRIRGTHAAVAD